MMMMMMMMRRRRRRRRRNYWKTCPDFCCYGVSSLLELILKHEGSKCIYSFKLQVEYYVNYFLYIVF